MSEPRDPDASSGRPDPAGDGGPEPVGVSSPPRHVAHEGHHRGLIAGRIVIALIAVLVLTGTGWEWAIKSRADSGIVSRSVQAIVTDDTHIATATATPTPAVGTEVYKPENILLLGSDTRAGAANSAAGGTDASTNNDVANSDSQMIAHISADRQHVTVLSIPRDTMIDAPTCKSWDAATGKLSADNYPVNPGDRWHINSAFSVGGPQCSVRAIQDLTGLRINRVIGIDFAGFQNMVDALGGVTVNVCGRIEDAELGLVVPAGGIQKIQGQQALSLVRARNVKGDKDSDLARIRRQQILLSAILQQVTSAGTLLNPVKLDSFLQAFVSNTFTDNVTIDDLVALAQSFGTLDPSRVTFFTMPTVPSTSNPDALEVDAKKAPAVFDALVNDRPLPGEPAATQTPATPKSSAATPTAPSSTPNSAKTVNPADVALTVVNLTGRSGAAGEAMTQLKDTGFDVTENDLQAPDGETDPGVTVQYEPSNLAAALTVAATVKGATLVPTAGLGKQVRLLLGQTWDGTISPVQAGVAVTGTVNTSAAADAAATPTLSSGALQSVNAGQELCA